MIRASRVSGLTLIAVVVGLPSARAADEDAVARAIDQGVAYLKKTQEDNGTWRYPHIGMTALAGLTLLECEVPAQDPAVQKAAEAVRQAALNLTHTYSLSLAIMFLDRLGNPGDIPLIQSMVVRLMAGQDGGGGWDYECPPLSEGEVRRLNSQIQQRNKLVAAGGIPEAPPRNADGRPVLSKELQDQVRLINRLRPGIVRTDNSNTQFATLALWVGRRHGMPVERALAAVESRFRTTQGADGGWGYTPSFKSGGPGKATSTPSMTCAGLLGLAVAHGVANALGADKGKPRRDPGRDPAVRGGLLALGTTVGQPIGKKVRREVLKLNDAQSYYYFWSLERVGVAYGLTTIGKKDWYAWGAEILVANQNDDGSWRGQYDTADTCFALLFLKRANLAKDLSTSLKGRVQDPGEVTLRSGGVGGEGLPGASVTPESEPTQASLPDKGDLLRQPPGTDKLAIPAPDASASGLGAALVQARGPRQAQLIEQFKEGKGSQYTQALAEAIHKLDGPAKEKARDALADRFVRMTPATLRARLRDEDLEIRSAAALACGMQEDKGYVVDLIELLTDPETRVSRAAYVALKSLSGQDFGPAADATAADRAAAAARWRSWWNNRKER